MTPRFYWRNIFQRTGVDQPEDSSFLVNSNDALPIPTSSEEGAVLRNRVEKLLLVYYTENTAGSVEFRVWFYLPGVGWYLETRLGTAGKITVGAVTDPAEAVIVTGVGTRVAIEVVANLNATDLVIYAYDGITEA